MTNSTQQGLPPSECLVISLVALVVAALALFSVFGLGTLLMQAFAVSVADLLHYLDSRKSGPDRMFFTQTCLTRCNIPA